MDFFTNSIIAVVEKYLMVQWVTPGGGDWGLARRPLTGLRALSKWAAREMHAELLIGSKTLSGVLNSFR